MRLSRLEYIYFTGLYVIPLTALEISNQVITAIVFEL